MVLSKKLTGSISASISGGSNIKLLQLKLTPENVVVSADGKPVIAANGQYVVTNNITNLLGLSNGTPIIDSNGSYIFLSEV